MASVILPLIKVFFSSLQTNKVDTLFLAVKHESYLVAGYPILGTPATLDNPIKLYKK